MKAVFRLLGLCFIFSLQPVLAPELNCVQNGEDGKPWLIFRADINGDSDLLEMTVRIADNDDTLLSLRRNPSRGAALESQNPKWRGYVRHSNIAYFTHPGSQTQYEVDLVVPGDLNSLIGDKFSAYSEIRMPAYQSTTLWGVSCSIDGSSKIL